MNKDFYYKVRPFSVLWAQLCAMFMTLWSFQRIITYSEYRCFSDAHWLVWDFHVVFIETEDGRLVYRSPHAKPEAVDALRTECRRIFRKR